MIPVNVEVFHSLLCVDKAVYYVKEEDSFSSRSPFLQVCQNVGR